MTTQECRNSNADNDIGVQNILRVFRRATPEERAHGIVWYTQAHHAAQALADDTGHSLSVCAAVISAISPNNSWGLNLAQAKAMLWATSDEELSAIGVSTYDGGDKGRAILRGKLRVDECGKTTQRRTHAFCHGRAYSRAPKTSAFFRLIRDGGNDWDVCVDGHAYNIYAGVGRTLEDAGKMTAGEYKAAAEAYRRASAILGVPAYVVQATTWLAQRRITGNLQAQNDPNLS